MIPPLSLPLSARNKANHFSNGDLYLANSKFNLEIARLVFGSAME
jgi:hypothetical protein